jgi:hypothetical protein
MARVTWFASLFAALFAAFRSTGNSVANLQRLITALSDDSRKNANLEGFLIVVARYLCTPCNDSENSTSIGVRSVCAALQQNVESVLALI